MDEFSENNRVLLCGTAAGRPVYSHSSRGWDFFSLPLEVRRLSGSVDRLPLLLRRELLEATELRDAGKLRVRGELRSFNNRRGEGAKLQLSVFVRELDFCDEEDGNQALLRGALCKPPILRSTPLGREICDLMLAVNRRCGRSDYLPCICWGSLARRAARWPVGQRLQLSGRLQSRDYRKLTEQGPETRTAYEVSAMEIEEEE
jgi:primosomal replication protein N